MRPFFFFPALLVLLPVTAWGQASSSGTLQLPASRGTLAQPPAASTTKPANTPPRTNATPPARGNAATAGKPGGSVAAPASKGARPQGAQAPSVSGSATPRRAGGRAAAAATAAGAAAVGAAAVAPAAPPAPAPAAPPEPQETVGSVTGLPLPRFAPLRSDEVNLRAGPGTRFPIEWTYQRRDLPVEIIREFDQWRRIRMQDGTEGWVHQSNLAPGRRSFTVGNAIHTIRRRPEDGANAVARIEPGVVGRVRACAAGSSWCEVQVGEYRGYLKRSEMFGVTGDEVIGN
ncbi:SH3 domain-containing protein [Roseomonas elaeocarpi]|uniref:SH3 domain-containing protein n=1 Tax=Roseomonas elaeocarpi TaxID=907779 RepID=A0ABV6JU36_9PROT